MKRREGAATLYIGLYYNMSAGHEPSNMYTYISSTVFQLISLTEIVYRLVVCRPLDQQKTHIVSRFEKGNLSVELLIILVDISVTDMEFF